MIFRYCNNCYQNPSNCLSHEKKSHPDLYTKLTKVASKYKKNQTFTPVLQSLCGVRVKDRDQGLVQVTEEQLGWRRLYPDSRM